MASEHWENTLHVPVVTEVKDGLNTQLPSVPPALQDSLNVYSAHLAKMIQLVPFETQPDKADAHSLLFVFFISAQVFFLQELESLSKIQGSNFASITHPAY